VKSFIDPLRLRLGDGYWVPSVPLKGDVFSPRLEPFYHLSGVGLDKFSFSGNLCDGYFGRAERGTVSGESMVTLFPGLGSGRSQHYSESY